MKGAVGLAAATKLLPGKKKKNLIPGRLRTSDIRFLKEEEGK